MEVKRERELCVCVCVCVCGSRCSAFLPRNKTQHPSKNETKAANKQAQPASQEGREKKKIS